MESYLIWWLGESACRQIGEPHSRSDYDMSDPEEAAMWERTASVAGVVNTETLNLPAYVIEQYESRYGRSGRGRLWVDEDIPVKNIRWNDNSPIAQRIMAEDAGGIVIRARDYESVRLYPGFVTDLELRLK